MDKLSPDGTKKPTYQPSRYMRARHPDLFSDSVPEVEYQVSREVLSYHLETLTNQKDETAFEHFAQRLCEKFIAPNIRPQTGPVGGGDGKTDAETYPVSKVISSRWFVPDNNEAADERRAFAFSAKKTWRSKIKSDVAAIAGTGRDYDHIYCVTNQFVPSKKSADLQDELKKEFGIPVTILDRTWLLDRVFQHGSLDIAVEELGVGQGAVKPTRKLGPADIARSAELESLEAAIADGSKYDGQQAALVADAHRAALIARSLELPRIEVDGRFERALRLAKENNLQKLELAVTYDWAWTSHFWNEDHQRTSQLYDEVERLAAHSDDANDLERLSNLLPLIRMSVLSGGLEPAKGNLKARSERLRTALGTLVGQTNRPNNALHAEAMLLLIRVSEKGVEHRDDPLRDIWVEFTDVIKRAEGLGTFPFIGIANALIGVGEYIADSIEFDRLFEAITDALAARKSEGEAATKNVQRAYQKLAKGLPYDATRWFGRAVGLLIKEEYEDDLIEALVGASFAFEAVGLPWAARNYALAALGQEFQNFKRTGNVGVLRPSILTRYYDAELQLGRLPQILSAHEIELVVRTAQATTEGHERRLAKVQEDHMMQIGSLLLHAPLTGLSEIGQLPDALERLALPMSRVALLYLMGHEDTLREEGWVPKEETAEGAATFIRQMYDFATSMGYRVPPEFGCGEMVMLSSNVLGCRIEVACANNLVSVGIGEAVLGSLEALLATSLDHTILPLVDHLQLQVGPSDDAGLAPTLNFTDVDGEPIGVVTHRLTMEYKTREDALSFPQWMKQAVLEIFTRFAAPSDVQNWAKALFDDEQGLDRALTFSNIPALLDTLHGAKSKISVSDWINPSDRIYEIKRTEMWPPSAPSSVPRTYGNAPRGEGTAPQSLRDAAKAKHSNTRWVSPIDARKWDSAKWNGTMFLWQEGAGAPAPILGLAYQNADAAKDIFRSLRKRYGQDDRKDDLRITIVRGISKDNPAAYGVMVGANPNNVPASEGSVVGFVSRINRMYPQTTTKLDAFLEQFERHGRYVLIPAHLPTRQSQPVPIYELPIGKHDLAVIDAWQIPPNDMVSSVLDLDELPYIPDDQPDPPVLKTLAWLRKLRSK
jgi:hypothetical protein